MDEDRLAYNSIKKGLEEALDYSTNWMGPYGDSWYKERNLDGSVLYSGGRIDIRGLDPNIYYDGCHEYGLPPMNHADFIKLSSWLEGFRTHNLVSFEELIKLFEEDCGEIRWAPEKS